MAANIDSFIGRTPAWWQLSKGSESYGKGTVTGHHMTWEEAEGGANLLWQVEKRQLEYAGQPVEAWGTFRNDSGAFLGAVGSDYKIIQHHEGFRMLDALVASADGAHYETAGAIDGGRRVWGLIDLNAKASVAGDEQDTFLAFTTAHDGSMSMEFRRTRVRIVCANTFAMATGARADLSVRHTKNADKRMIDMERALQTIHREDMDLTDRLNFLATRKVTKESLTSIMDRLFPAAKDEDGKDRDTSRRNNMLAQVLKNMEHNDGDAYPQQRGTLYNVFNAVTEFVDHQRSTKTDGNGDAVKSRAASAMFGAGAKLKQEALEVIHLAANGAPIMETRTVFVPAPPAPTPYELPAEALAAGHTSMLDWITA